MLILFVTFINEFVFQYLLVYLLKVGVEKEVMSDGEYSLSSIISGGSHNSKFRSKARCVIRNYLDFDKMIQEVYIKILVGLHFMHIFIK